jgi:hypothetical protein
MKNDDPIRLPPLNLYELVDQTGVYKCRRDTTIHHILDNIQGQMNIGTWIYLPLSDQQTESAYASPNLLSSIYTGYDIGVDAAHFGLCLVAERNMANAYWSRHVVGGLNTCIGRLALRIRHDTTHQRIGHVRFPV